MTAPPVVVALTTSTRAGSILEISDNQRLALAALLGCARVNPSAIERALATALRLELHIPELVWVQAVKHLTASRKSFSRTSLLGLLRDGKVTSIFEKVNSNDDVRTIVRIVNNWTMATIGSGNINCRVCSTDVAAGIECTPCGLSWHYGCAWKAFSESQRTSIIPQETWFRPQGIVRFKCHVCLECGRKPASVKGSLLERFRILVVDLQVHETWDLLSDALGAGPSRRWLPGARTSRGGTNGGRFLATAAVSILANAAEAGDRSAELLLLYAPRLFMRKGKPIDVQLADLVDRRITKSTPPGRGNREADWAAAVESVLSAGWVKKLVLLIEQGPRLQSTSAPDPDDVRRHFPQQGPSTFNEAASWQALRLTIRTRRTGFATVDLKKWSRTHATSSGGSCGWTGALFQHINKADAQVGAQLARLWARPPNEWHLSDARKLAYRSTDGWLIPKPDGIERRPIAAPQIVRKVGSAALMARARPATDRYCRTRWQFGLSGDAHCIAYSMIPLLTCATGGSVLVADRSQSFQTIKREAVLASVTDLVAHALPTETEAVAALVDACLEYYVQTSGRPLLNSSKSTGTSLLMGSLRVAAFLPPSKR